MSKPDQQADRAATGTDDEFAGGVTHENEHDRHEGDQHRRNAADWRGFVPTWRKTVGVMELWSAGVLGSQLLCIIALLHHSITPFLQNDTFGASRSASALTSKKSRRPKLNMLAMKFIGKTSICVL